METNEPTYVGMKAGRSRVAGAITYTEYDASQPFLVLHGGGGPATVAAFAAMLAGRKHVRVLAPSHPGFSGTARPEGFDSVAALAKSYLALLETEGLTDVTVIGNSFGAWVAAEMGLHNNGRVSGLVLVDAVGPVIPEHPPLDITKIPPQDLSQYSFHDPRKQPKRPGPAGQPGPSPDVLAMLAYTGKTMSDPTLLDRLAGLDLPVHVIWGASDRIVTPAYGEVIAKAIRGAKFTVLPATGHLPQLETPEELLGALANS